MSDRIPGLVAALHALADQIGEEAIKPEASLSHVSCPTSEPIGPPYQTTSAPAPIGWPYESVCLFDWVLVDRESLKRVLALAERVKEKGPDQYRAIQKIRWSLKSAAQPSNKS